MPQAKNSNNKLLAFDRAQIMTNRIGNALSLGADAESRTIYLVGEITDDLAYRFMTAFHAMDSEQGPIRIILSSPGGSDSAGYAIFDTIKLAQNPVLIDGYGAVQSIASLILQAGSYRRLSPETRFMIHNGSINLNGGVDANTMVAIGKEVDRNNDRYHRILADRAGKTQQEVQALCTKESYYSAHEAVEFGFADEVLGTVKLKKQEPVKKGKK